MSTFPVLGIEYGVFADWDSDFPLNIDKGYVYTDDEDSSNANGYNAYIDWKHDAQRIISGATIPILTWSESAEERLARSSSQNRERFQGR